MRIWKDAVLFYLGGMCYMLLEVLWRGWSHGSMFLVGGLCFLLIGAIDRVCPGMPLFMQGVVGAVLVTAMELVSGLIINRVLNLGVWDYSYLPYNFMGQVCMAYFFLWILVSWAAVVLEDGLRWGLFGEQRVKYRIF